MALVKNFKERVKLAHYRYELTTALYMLDPWEKAIFNFLVLLGVALFLYTAISYTPEYVTDMLRSLSEYFPSLDRAFNASVAAFLPPIGVKTEF